MKTQKSINRKCKKEFIRFDNTHAYISIFAKMVTIFFLNKKKRYICLGLAGLG